MENDEPILSNCSNKPSLNQPQNGDLAHFHNFQYSNHPKFCTEKSVIEPVLEIGKPVTEPEVEINGPVVEAEVEMNGPVVETEVEMIEPEVELKGEEEEGGGGEETEGLESKEEVIGKYEVSGLVDGGGGMSLSGEVRAGEECRAEVIEPVVEMKETVVESVAEQVEEVNRPVLEISRSVVESVIEPEVEISRQVVEPVLEMIEPEVELKVKEDGSGEETEGSKSYEELGSVDGGGGMELSGEMRAGLESGAEVDMGSVGEDKGVSGIVGGGGVVVEEEIGEGGEVELEKDIGGEKNVNSDIGNDEILGREMRVVAESDAMVVSGCGSVQELSTEVDMDSLGEDTAVLEENSIASETTEVVEQLAENAKVELVQVIAIENNVNSEIVEKDMVGMDIRVDDVIGNGEGGVHELDDSVQLTITDYDKAMSDRVVAGILGGKEKMEMDICAESNMRMGEGSKSEHASTSCDPVVHNEGIVVAHVEDDEVKEARMEENFVGVSEKEEGKRVELAESDVGQHEKDEVNEEVEENDGCKDMMEEFSSYGDTKLYAEKEVGMNMEECSDYKEVDSESTVSESLLDDSVKDKEIEGKEEGRAGDVRMEPQANSGADILEIRKEEEPEVTGDPDVPQTPQDEEMVPEETTNADTEMETEPDVAESEKEADGKRKRGKNTIAADTKSTPKARKTTEEDDVCFICFDGGALVLCDRRGCPKAYHPHCVNQDEAFFARKSRWNCGWHSCSLCEKKSAQYLCYTCPFSLCKGCIKDAVIFCVRGNKGFCVSCMKFVKLLESNEQGVKDVQVNFNDTGNWEYLFRDYFTQLKSKLSISSTEIAEAKSPWKGHDTYAGKDDKPRSSMQRKHDVKQESRKPPNEDAELDTENFNENEEASKPRKKAKKRLKTRRKGKTSADTAEAISDEDGPVNTEWASNELLEFVMHMKSGDGSILSEYDVQALLLEYIKRNNLRDPRHKARIICDSRLQSLFGKPRVGHFEMLKLLESHFFVKEDLHTGDVQGSVVDTNSEQLEVDGNADTLKGSKEKKRKSRRKGDRRGRQSNLDDYAAIDIHNISLIYLRRKLMEDLLEDSETFHDKVVGTFVRIRISGSVQNQDIYRLVQVVDTSNAAEPYKVGRKTTNIMVEILNLNKTEVIPIDTVSNQDFTEDECKRLRQSIKCGLINLLTVGDILDKATDLQTAKVNDWLETEVVRLSHLRDRASDMGRKKELRECVEKVQLLKTPEERQRRLEEIPEIHTDPKMDPTYESEEDNIDVDENSQDVNSKIRGGSRGERGPISPGSEILSKDPFSGGSRYLRKNWELDRNLSSKNLLHKGGENTTNFGEVQDETSWKQVRDGTSLESSNLDKFRSTVGSDTLGWDSHYVPKSESISSSVSNSAPALAKAAESIKINESEKNWYYKDPSGKVQGPFSMVQLRKWNNTGYFPAGLKVWRSNETQEDSIFLTDALSGKFPKESAATASVLSSSLSANLTNIVASLEHSREQPDRKKLRSDQDVSSNLPNHIVSPGGQGTPSVGHANFSSKSLPSPTPLLNNAGFTREGGSLSSGTYFGRNRELSSPTAVAPECQGRSSTPTSGLRFGETLRASQNEPVCSGSSGVQVGHSAVSDTSQNLQAAINSEARAMQVHGNVVVAQDSFAPQTISNHPTARTPGWGSAQPQIIDTNAALPVQPQIQSHGQWGNIPAAGYAHRGNFPQGNQPNMQFPGLPNTSWGVVTPESNTTTVTAPRPEIPNPNFGWGVMQGNQNTLSVGAPLTNANANWGAAPLQGPPPANQNMVWTMPAGNLGAAVQGQLPAGSGWTTGTQNPPVQGLPPAGNVHQNWVAHTGNIPSNVHMPASGSGWSPAPGNLGAPVPGLVPGNANQGLSMRPENQGHWGTDQNHSGGQFSNQRDQGSHGGDSAYGGNMSRSRPPSFSNVGQGGPSRHFPKHQMPCPYNRGGRCRKGAACDYVHT